MPLWFDSTTHDSLHNQLVLQKPKHETEWVSFGIAWKGVAYRLRTAAAYSSKFTESVTKTHSPEPEERFLQDDAIFVFFSSALSAIECFSYAAYCVGAIISPFGFPAATPQDLQKVSPSNVAKLFAHEFPTEAISIALTSVISDANFVSLSEIRNVLSHRGVPPRSFFQGGDKHGRAMMPANPKAPAGQWDYSLEINSLTTADKFQWLALTMADLMKKLDAFCSARLVI